MSDDAISEGLLAALDGVPEDPMARAALADWFEEHGDGPATECLRWTVRNGRRPGASKSLRDYGMVFWERLERPLLNDPPAQLPEDLWLALGDNGEPHQVGHFKSYQSPRHAYLALLEGWKRLGRPVPDLAGHRHSSP